MGDTRLLGVAGRGDVVILACWEVAGRGDVVILAC